MHMLNYYMYGCWMEHQSIDHVVLVVSSFIYRLTNTSPFRNDLLVIALSPSEVQHESFIYLDLIVKNMEVFIERYFKW
jgi:hypothetical protein